MKRQSVKELQATIKDLRFQLRDLRNTANDYYRSVEFPRRVSMWQYNADGTTYSITSLFHRVTAAAQLGYFCKLVPTNEDGKDVVKVTYVKNPIQKPLLFNY